jgi:hypothetical protein
MHLIDAKYGNAMSAAEVEEAGDLASPTPL